MSGSKDTVLERVKVRQVAAGVFRSRDALDAAEKRLEDLPLSSLLAGPVPAKSRPGSDYRGLGRRGEEEP